MKLIRKLITALFCLSTAACGFFSGRTDSDDAKVESGPEDVVYDTRVGPNTKRLIRELPEGLVGDHENARHTSETLRGDDSTGNQESGGSD